MLAPQHPVCEPARPPASAAVASNLSGTSFSPMWDPTVLPAPGVFGDRSLSWLTSSTRCSSGTMRPLASFLVLQSQRQSPFTSTNVAASSNGDLFHALPPGSTDPATFWAPFFQDSVNQA